MHITREDLARAAAACEASPDEATRDTAVRLRQLSLAGLWANTIRPLGDVKGSVTPGQLIYVIAKISIALFKEEPRRNWEEMIPKIRRLVERGAWMVQGYEREEE